jgi:hypothetical protein
MPSKSANASSPLAETLKQLPKKSAQESLGLPEGNGLFIPFVAATIGIMFFLVVLTAVPYFFAKQGSSSEQPTAPTANDKQESSPSNQQAVTPAPPSKTSDSTSKVAPKGTGKNDFADKLGENSTKTAKPNVNPLDKKDDDILKEIK